MKVSDLEKQLPQQPEIAAIEIKPGAKYLLHIKTAISCENLEAIEKALQNTPLKGSVVWAGNEEIDLYELKQPQ